MSAMEEDWELNDINTATDYREETEKNPTSFGPIPENLNERSAHAEGFTKESNIYAANIQVTQEKDSDEKKKPWRRAGVDITDYFNYGFDEKSWNAYCKKQSKVCALRRKLHANIRAQRGYTRYGEESESSREAYDTIGSGCREESYVRYLSDGGTNLQTDTKNLHWEDSMTAFLTAGYNRNSVGTFIPPQSFQNSPATLDSRCSNDFDGPSTSQHHFSLGSMAVSAGAMNAAKAWEHIIWQERCIKDRSQSREHGHAQHSKRSQHKESHYFSRSREEGQKKHRDTTVQEHKHASFEKVSEEKMQIDNDEGQQEASQRSSSNKSTKDVDRKDRGEDQKKHRDTTVQEHKHVSFEKVSGEERRRETSNGQHETSQSNRSSSNRSSRDGGHKDRKSRRKRKKRTRKTRRARGCPLTEKGN